MTRKRASVVIGQLALDMQPEYLECRDLAHPWQPYRAWRISGGFQRILRCPRCESEKHQDLNARGQVVYTRIKYPDGYLVKGMGHLDGDARAALRLASVQAQVKRYGNLKSVPA